MTSSPGKEIRAFGTRIYTSRHPAVRRLKREYVPSAHGNKLWNSSWLLMDYFDRYGLPQGSHVMEVGCGWGLAGIYCAKKHGASVTAVDVDPDVFPFLELHAEANGVTVNTRKRALGGLQAADFRGVDVVIGADICFWDSMVLALKRLGARALSAGVHQVLIADPGRSTFEELSEYFKEKSNAEVLEWKTRRPRAVEGQILKISSR